MNFSKKQRTERVIQFGEGGFLRGFVDWMLQKVNENSDFDGSVVVVQPIEQGMCDMLTAQDCIYTQVIRGVEGVDTTIVDVISRCVKPYEDFAAYLALASYYRYAETPDADKILEICKEAKANAYQGDYTYMPYMAIAYLFKGEGAVALETMEEYMTMSGYTVQTCNLFALCAAYNGNDEIYNEMKTVLETSGYELSVLVEKYKNDKITIEEALTDMGGDI